MYLCSIIQMLHFEFDLSRFLAKFDGHRFHVIQLELNTRYNAVKTFTASIWNIFQVGVFFVLMTNFY